MAENLELVIPGFVPDSRLSLNGRLRTHWRTLSRLRDETKNVVGFALLARGIQMGADPLFDQARVAIDFVYPNRRRRDPDGLAGQAKPILDFCVDWGLLKDDSSECIDLAVRALCERGVTETRIRIWGR